MTEVCHPAISCNDVRNCRSKWSKQRSHATSTISNAKLSWFQLQMIWAALTHAACRCCSRSLSSGFLAHVSSASESACQQLNNDTSDHSPERD